jgi:hypothetical protein
VHVNRAFGLAFLLGACLATFRPVYAQLVLGVSVDKAPPPLPVYDQPPIAAAGYLWVPGYWAWGGRHWLLPGTRHLDIATQGWFIVDAGILGVGSLSRRAATTPGPLNTPACGVAATAGWP